MNKIKTLAILAVVAFLTVVGFRIDSFIKQLQGEKVRLHEELQGKTEAYKQLSDHAAKLEIQYKDAKALEDRLNKDFAKEKGALEGRIKVLSNATFIIREKARTSGASDLSYQGDKLKYVVNEIRFNEGPPVGYVLIFDDGRVVSKIYKHEIDVKTAIARDEKVGKYSIISKADYILKSPSINVNGEKVWTNKPFPLKISGGTATIDPTENNPLTRRFFLWAPHLNGGFGVLTNFSAVGFLPSLDFSVAGIGVTKNDLDWKFLHLGLDLDLPLERIGVHVIPFSFRFIPLLNNTYFGLGVGWRYKGGTNLQLNVNFTF